MTKTPTRLLVLQALLITTAVFWVFSPAFHGGWLWDDTHYFPQNPLLHHPDWLAEIWISPSHSLEYYPIFSTVQWLQWHLWGEAPLGYHLTNVALHVLGSLLIWRFLEKLGVKLAWLGGFLFAVHPLTVESVAWISELKNTLSLPPMLLALCAWIDYDERRQGRDRRRALVWFAVALLCKTSVLMLPVILLLHAWWKRGQIGWNDLRNTAPFFALSLMMGGVQAWLQYSHALPAAAGISPWAQGATFGHVIFFYLGKFILPVGLLPVYPSLSVQTPAPFDLLPWLLLVAVCGAAWIKRASWGRHVLLGLGFFLVNLVPVLGFVIASPAMTWSLDHLVYISLIGLIGLSVAGLGQLSRYLSTRGRISGGACLVALATWLGWESHAYAGVFASPSALWNYTLRHNPDAWAAHLNLGYNLWKEGRLTEAASEFEATLKIKPDNTEAHNNLSCVFLAQGRVSEALVEAEKAVTLNSQNGVAHNTLGNALYLSGHAAEATVHYREAVRLDPDYPEAHNGLANALLQTGELLEAQSECEKALKLNPRYADAYCTLGLILAQQGQIPQAIEQFETALQFNPANARIQAELSSLRELENNASEKK